MPGLPPARRLVNDMIGLSRSAAMYLVERPFHLGPVADLRRRARPRISWTVLFVKAHALVAAASPALRQAYCRWPWPRLYEHPDSSASIAVSRSGPDGERLFWARLRHPARKSLVQLQATLDRYRTAPVEELFPTQLRLSRLPGLLRWCAWRLAFSFSGKVRAKKFGTFGVSTLAGQGIYSRLYPSFLTSNLALGPVDEQGNAMAGILFDHRVMDGSTIVGALADMERVLLSDIAQELGQLCSLSTCA
jgi:hypothetical protein